MSDERMSDELAIEALRRFGWLRNDGDGERLHMTRNPLAETDEDRCKGYWQRRCAFKAGHHGPHEDAEKFGR